jgi:hypothetical protein
MSDCGAPASASADIDHGDGQDGLNIPCPRSKEQDFIESLSRRPSFMDHLADSRESQFHVQDRSELERYFVCSPSTLAPKRNAVYNVWEPSMDLEI